MIYVSPQNLCVKSLGDALDAAETAAHDYEREGGCLSEFDFDDECGHLQHNFDACPWCRQHAAGDEYFAALREIALARRDKLYEGASAKSDLDTLRQRMLAAQAHYKVIRDAGELVSSHEHYDAAVAEEIAESDYQIAHNNQLEVRRRRELLVDAARAGDRQAKRTVRKLWKQKQKRQRAAAFAL